MSVSHRERVEEWDSVPSQEKQDQRRTGERLHTDQQRQREKCARQGERGSDKVREGSSECLGPRPILRSSCIHVRQTGLSPHANGSVYSRRVATYSLVTEPHVCPDASNLTSAPDTFRAELTSEGPSVAPTKPIKRDPGTYQYLWPRLY